MFTWTVSHREDVRYSRRVDEALLVDGLRRRDEHAFAELVRMYQASLLRVAQMYVASRAVAEEVVQETWLAVLNGIDRFEGRASFKTWLFRILTNTAKTRGQREARSVPFAALADDHDAIVEPERFAAAGHWSSPPRSWPEEQLADAETRAVIAAAIGELPPAQRTVISLRDVEGWSAEEVRNALELSETNQRVLLHRARTKVRRALERYFEADR